MQPRTSCLELKFDDFAEFDEPLMMKATANAGAESRKVKQLQESIRLAAAAGERKMSACPQVGTKIPAGKGPVEEWKCINLCSNIPECNTINYVPGTCVTKDTNE